MTDLIASNLVDENWCSTPPTVKAVSGGGLVSGATRNCIYGDNKNFAFPFIPYTVTDPVGCSDASTFFTYSIVYDPLFSSTNAHISLDPSSNTILVELGAAMTSTQAERAYNFIIQGTLPNR